MEGEDGLQKGVRKIIRRLVGRSFYIGKFNCRGGERVGGGEVGVRRRHGDGVTGKGESEDVVWCGCGCGCGCGWWWW